MDEASPAMLATRLLVRSPNPLEPRVGPQIINMPVRSLRQLLVVRKAGPQASRPQGAAHVNVEASTQFEGTELPDLNPLLTGTKED